MLPSRGLPGICSLDLIALVKFNKANKWRMAYGRYGRKPAGKRCWNKYRQVSAKGDKKVKHAKPKASSCAGKKLSFHSKTFMARPD